MFWANKAQLEIQSRIKDRASSNLPNSIGNPTDMTSPGVRLYSLPDTIMDIYYVTVNGIKQNYCKYEDLPDMGGMTFNKFQSLPYYYYFQADPTSGKNMIGFWPCPGSAWYIIYMGIKKPTPMTKDADSPDLDDRLHYAVIYSVCESMAEARRENDRGAYWKGLFENELQKYTESARQTVQGTRFLNDATPTD